MGPDHAVGGEARPRLEALHGGFHLAAENAVDLVLRSGVRRSARSSRRTVSPVAPKLMVGAPGLFMPSSNFRDG